ncbi:hypothetical protein KM043_016523 [Ampulex compressa]|nr:hypothetical protein KM043_016523 [Ampulex compressa]
MVVDTVVGIRDWRGRSAVKSNRAMGRREGREERGDGGRRPSASHWGKYAWKGLQKRLEKREKEKRAPERNQDGQRQERKRKAEDLTRKVWTKGSSRELKGRTAKGIELNDKGRERGGEPGETSVQKREQPKWNNGTIIQECKRMKNKESKENKRERKHAETRESWGKVGVIKEKTKARPRARVKAKKQKTEKKKQEKKREISTTESEERHQEADPES